MEKEWVILIGLENAGLNPECKYKVSLNITRISTEVREEHCLGASEFIEASQVGSLLSEIYANNALRYFVRLIRRKTDADSKSM
jgi:hypothetical protein